MLNFIDAFLPWFNDILELGGAILLVILSVAALLWILILERLYFIFMCYPSIARHSKKDWASRAERHSWFAQKYRDRLALHLNWGLTHQLSSIRILIIVCPLLGLLGTVVGMLEVFDSMAATGTNNPRSTAAGVSKATVSTMAGMVVAISGLMATTLIERRVAQAKSNIDQLLSFQDDLQADKNSPKLLSLKQHFLKNKTAQ